LVWLTAGCAAAPPGPRGPLSEAGAQFAVDWSVAVASAKYREAGRAPTNSTADYYGLNFPIPPRRLEARLAPVSWADIGGDMGWIDGGVDVRFGLPSAPGRFWAGNVAFGLRSGRGGPIPETRGTHGYWVRLEAYPLLHESHGARGALDSHRGVLSLGLDSGVFLHQVELPAKSIDSSDDESFDFGPDTQTILRRELRLEAAIGYCVKPHNGAGVLLGIEPYWVLRGDDGGGGPAESSYRQSWGVVFVLNGSFFLRAHQPASANATP
jgi:hypothetical protein